MVLQRTLIIMRPLRAAISPPSARRRQQWNSDSWLHFCLIASKEPFMSKKVLPVRHRCIDLVRGFAAFAVLIWHYQHFYHPAAGVGMPLDLRASQPFYKWLWPMYHYGLFAVELFWALSGFVFAAAYLTCRPTARTFLVNRIARLYPLHLLTLIIVASLQLASLWIVGHYQIYAANDAYHFLLNIGMVQAWGFQEGFSYNAPTWSVSIEIAIYVVFFTSIPVLARFPLAGSLGCLTVAICIRILSNSLFIECAMFFYVGVVCWAVSYRNRRCAIFLSLKFFVLFAIIKFYLEYKFYKCELIFLFASVILLSSFLDKYFPERFVGLDWFGNATYSTYLLHVPLQIAVLIVLQWLAVDQIQFAQHGWVLIGFVATVFALGVASYRFIEAPARSKVKLAFLLSYRNSQSPH